MTMKTLVVVAMLMLTAAATRACGGPYGPPAASATPSATASAFAVAGGPCVQSGQVYCVVNAQVTQATIRTTICRSGWTKTVRPPASYTDQLKIDQLQKEGLASDPATARLMAPRYEEDHRLPLELGGDPRDPHNLSPEPHSGSYAKDADETAYKNKVCNGELPLLAAQDQFIARWLGPYPTYRAA